MCRWISEDLLQTLLLIWSLSANSNLTYNGNRNFYRFLTKKRPLLKATDQDDDDGLVKQDDDDWNEGAWGKSEATYGATWRLTTCPIFSITVVIVIILFQIIIVQFSAFPQSPVSSLLLLWLELQSPPKIIMVKTKT